MKFKDRYKDKDYIYFRSDNNEVIAFKYTYGMSDCFIRQGGKGPFLAIKGGLGYASSSKNNDGTRSVTERYTGEHILNEKEYVDEFKLYRVEDKATLIIGSWTFDLDMVKTDFDIMEEEFRELPVIDQIQYLHYANHMKCYILVTGRKYNYAYETSKVYFLYTETNEIFQEEVKEFVRYRDGGTTIISLKSGEQLYYPTPFKQDEVATFDNVPIEKINKEEIHSQKLMNFLDKLNIEYTKLPQYEGNS